MDLSLSKKELVSAYDYYASSFKFSKFETVSIFNALEARKGPVMIDVNFQEFTGMSNNEYKKIKKQTRKLSSSESEELDWYPADANVLNWEDFCQILKNQFPHCSLRTTDLMFALVEYKAYKLKFLERRQVTADAYELLEFRRINTERDLEETKGQLKEVKENLEEVKEDLFTAEIEKITVEAEKLVIEEKLGEVETELEEAKEFVERVIPRHVPRNRVTLDKRDKLCIFRRQGDRATYPYQVIRGQFSYVEKQIQGDVEVLYNEFCPNPREAWKVLKRQGEIRGLLRSNNNKFGLAFGVNINEVLNLLEQLEQERAQA